MLMAATGFVVNPSLYDKVHYDPLKDFEPVAEVTTFPVIYAVRPDIGVNTMQELIAYAKKRAGGLNYSTPGAGTLPHLAAELLKLHTGIEMVHIPYPGAAPAAQALLGKTVDVASISISVAKPQIDAGNLIGLAVTGGERWPELPERADRRRGRRARGAGRHLAGPDGAGRHAEGDRRPARRRRLIEVVRRPDVRERLLKAGFHATGRGPGRFPQAHRRGAAEMEDCDRESAASRRSKQRSEANKGDGVTSPVLFETKNDCLDVILNRPDEGNLITNEMGARDRARAARASGPRSS